LRYDKRIGNYLSPLDDTLEWECPKPHPEAMIILRQQCELLLDAIAALPVQCRHVFLLRKIDELSYAQIAGKLAISEKTVQRHLVKAMLHCHRRLGLVPA
jgi:RNA polymerase sigma-70 factor (ECF subfamily)